jgi:hypothetical protein
MFQTILSVSCAALFSASDGAVVTGDGRIGLAPTSVDCRADVVFCLSGDEALLAEAEEFEVLPPPAIHKVPSVPVILQKGPGPDPKSKTPMGSGSGSSPKTPMGSGSGSGPKSPMGPIVFPKTPMGPIIYPKLPSVVIRAPQLRIPYRPVVTLQPPIIYVPGPTVVPIPIETPMVLTGNTTAMRILELAPRGPAARAGLQVGDIILKIDGRRTRTFEDVRAALIASPGKSEVIFYDSDDNKTDAVEVTVVGRQIGMTVDQIRITLDEANGDVRLEVTKVARGPAARAGILAGDLILNVNGKAVATEADFAAVLATVQDECELQVYMPSEGKTEMRRVKVVNGGIGVEVRAVSIARN